MGCDIHAFIEYIPSPDREWRIFGELELERRYDLFGLMAGVRGDGFLFAARGFPEDVSDKIRREYDDWGGHSSSWLSAGEFMRVYIEAMKGTGFPYAFRAALQALNSFQIDGCESRLVFWFDS